jgi:hypothetical protein
MVSLVSLFRFSLYAYPALVRSMSVVVVAAFVVVRDRWYNAVPQAGNRPGNAACPIQKSRLEVWLE